MTTMIEKPQSKKAKSFNRFSGTQDHGAKAARKGHDKSGYFENKYDRRGIVTRNNLVDYSGTTNKELSHEQLEAEADRLLAESEANEEQNVDYFDGRLRYYDSLDDRSLTGRIKVLVERFKELYVLRLELIDSPDFDENNPEMVAELTRLEDELEGTEDELVELLQTQDEIPSEAEVGAKSRREIRDSLAREAMAADFNEDDFGDDDNEKTMRIHNIR